MLQRKNTWRVVQEGSVAGAERVGTTGDAGGEVQGEVHAKACGFSLHDMETPGRLLSRGMMEFNQIVLEDVLRIDYRGKTEAVRPVTRLLH